MPGLRVCAAVLLVGVLLAGCGGHRARSLPLEISDAPGATSVCGSVLGVGAGTFLTDVTGKPLPTLTFTAGGLVYLKTTKDCVHGDRVRITQTGQAKVTRAVPARDGTDLGVVIEPLVGARFTVVGIGALPFRLSVALPPTPLPT
jgi:hypothetical protein